MEGSNLTQFIKVFLVGNNNIAPVKSKPTLMQRSSVPLKHATIHFDGKKGRTHIGRHFSVKPI
jgi:hypothetical protein